MIHVFAVGSNVDRYAVLAAVHDVLDGLKLIVDSTNSNNKTSAAVKGKDFEENRSDGGWFAVFDIGAGDELDRIRDSHKEYVGISIQDVSFQHNVFIIVNDWPWNRDVVITELEWLLPWRFALDSTKVWTKNDFGSLNVLLCHVDVGNHLMIEDPKEILYGWAPHHDLSIACTLSSSNLVSGEECLVGRNGVDHGELWSNWQRIRCGGKSDTLRCRNILPFLGAWITHIAEVEVVTLGEECGGAARRVVNTITTAGAGILNS